MLESVKNYPLQVSGYPSNGQLANVSKDTTIRELLEVEGVEKEEFKKQNINLFFGAVNHIEYCTEMFNFPTVYTVDEYVNNYLENIAEEALKNKSN